MKPKRERVWDADSELEARAGKKCMIHLLLEHSDQKAGQQIPGREGGSPYDTHAASYSGADFMSYIPFLIYFFPDGMLLDSRLSRHGSERFG
jgi:hypothetical protein